jgi:hypothetical protein
MGMGISWGMSVEFEGKCVGELKNG